MAGAWVKMRVGIGRDPKVIAMTDYLACQREFIDSVCDPVRLSCKTTCYECVTRDVLRGATVASLIEVWGVTRELGKVKDVDVILDHCTLDTLDAIAGRPCFGAALAHVGWAVEESDGRGNTWVRFPKFLLNNVPAEDRSRELHVDRQRRYRERRRHDETPCVAPTVAPQVAPQSDDRGEKRREEKSKKETPLPPIPESLDTPEFREAWASWIAHRKEKREPVRHTSATRQLKQLAAMGAARAVACIEHTIFKGWTGLREPEPERNGVHGAPAPDLKARIARLFPEEGEE